MLGKQIGSIFILVGSAIGAGMLALPILGAAAGFWISIITLILIWAIMLTTSLLTLEVNLAFPPFKNNFGTMARETLGVPGAVVAWISFLLLLYATTASYIAGSTSLLDELLLHGFNINLPAWCDSLIFTLVFGSAVYYSVSTVDYLIRFLLSIKGVLLILTIALLMPYIDYSKLILHSSRFNYIWVAVPIFVNAFGFHFVIPSISTYCDKNARVLRRVIIIASVTPLIIYIFWLFVTLGIVPLLGKDSFQAVAQNHTSIGGFIFFLGKIIQNKTVVIFINAFSNIAMTTSFLGVSLGLFDFLADGFKRKNTRFGRLQTALLTFTLPFIFAILYPDGFILALEYSAFFAIVLEIFLPAFMAYKLRKSKVLQSEYHCCMNKPIITVALTLIGIIFMTIIITERLGLLPQIF